MKILFVCDDFLNASNGTYMTAKRFKESLEKMGHEVRICAIGVVGDNCYTLKKRNIPIVDHFAGKQDTNFAQPDNRVLIAAMDGVDVVHTFMPWAVARRAQKLAKKLGIPYTSSFHTHPDSIVMNVPVFGKVFPKLIRKTIFSQWKGFYNRTSNIHCPSSFAAAIVKKVGYRCKPHVISNGITNRFFPAPDLKVKDINNLKDDEFFNVAVIGRYATEKRQEIAIKAVALSKYKHRIRLCFAGNGPTRNYLEKLLKEYGLNYELNGFVHDIKRFLDKSDLYLHPAEVEIEGMTCLEAFGCGKIPIVANSKKSATPQFAIDDRCLFKVNNPQDLANKMDYLIENIEDRKELTKKYIEFTEFYRQEHSTKKLVEMFEEAKADFKVKTEAVKTNKGKRMRKMINRPLLEQMFSYILYYGLVSPVMFVINTFAFKFNVKGKRNILPLLKKNQGAVSIVNHVHILDSTFAALANFPKKPIFTTLPANFKLPVAGKIVNILGAVPVPITPTENKVFFYELTRKLQRGKIVHFYPEGNLVPYNTGLQDFKRGAFNLACLAKVPIVPMAITYKHRKDAKQDVLNLLNKIGDQINDKPVKQEIDIAKEMVEKLKGKRKNPRLTLVIGKPIYPDFKLLERDMISKLQEESEEAMEELIKNKP